MTEATVDKSVEEYPEEIQRMYDEALIKGKDSVQYEILLTVAENINETKDDVEVNISFDKSI